MRTGFRVFWPDLRNCFRGCSLVRSARFGCSLLLFTALLRPPATAAVDEPLPADAWLTNGVAYPPTLSGGPAALNAFSQLHAESILDHYLVCTWTPAQLNTNDTVVLVVSADEPGHWPVRDWREYPMRSSGNGWAARPHVDSAHVPLVYFVRVSNSMGTNHSPMRICRPDLAGLTGPSRPFDPFLEGFEQGTEGWTVVTDKSEDSQPTTDTVSRSGYRSLKISVPAGKRSSTVATTRVRGWQLTDSQATALELWMRTRKDNGRARFTLHSDAFTTSQTAITSTNEATITDQWQKIKIPLASFPNLSPGRVDWFSIECLGSGPIDFFIDDLRLLGPWREPGY